jgi:hypothetical protein
MDSRISIKGDFVENTPYIDVVYSPSDDSRDEMVKAFTEKLEHTSAWCWIEWQAPTESNGRMNFRIYPIPPHKLEFNIERMQETLRVHKAYCEAHFPPEPIK